VRGDVLGWFDGDAAEGFEHLPQYLLKVGRCCYCCRLFFLCDELAAYGKPYIRPGTTLGTSPISVWR
jgi:hypothetical protein